MSAPVDVQEKIRGEGDVRVSIETRVRCECDNCGEPATKRIGFAYVNGRRNPASSMYGRDDCTYCTDSVAFACAECEREVERGACPNGMEWASTTTLGAQSGHYFLHWHSRTATDEELEALARVQGGEA